MSSERNWEIIKQYEEIKFEYFNGIGKIKLQLYTAIIQLLIFFPLALSLSKIAGAPGIIWATSILLAITTIALGWQVLLLTKRSPIKIINQ